MLRVATVALTIFPIILFAGLDTAHGETPGQDPGSFTDRLMGISAVQPVVSVISAENEIQVRAEHALLEDVLQELSNTRDQALHFYCLDPTSLLERRSLEVKDDSVDALLPSILHAFQFGEDIAMMQKEPASDAAVSAASTVHVRGASCPPEDPPLRRFLPIERHPVRWQSPAETRLENLERVLNNEGPASRRRAVADLTRLQTREAMAVAAQVVVQDPNPLVIEAAARSLETLGQQDDEEAAAADAVYRSLQNRPHIETLFALAKLDKERTWGVIEVLIESSPKHLQPIILRVLAVTRDTRGLTWLQKMAFKDDPAISTQAIRIIALVGGPEAASALGSILANGSSAQQAEAAKAISFLADDVERRRAEGDLQTLLRRDNAPVEVFDALLRVSYLQPLERILSDPASSPALKEKVLRAVGARGSARTMDLVALVADDPSPDVRLAAVNAIKQNPSESALPLLLGSIVDKDTHVRAAAATVLGMFGPDATIVAALENALNDHQDVVRRAAVDAFAELGKPDKPMEAALRKATKNEDNYVASTARSLLQHWRLGDTQ